MNNIRIITDSASDMPAGYRDDVTVVPLHVRFGTEEYLDGVNLTHREFYEKLIENDELPTTSQVAPFAFEEQYEKAREAGEQVIALLRASCFSEHDDFPALYGNNRLD